MLNFLDRGSLLPVIICSAAKLLLLFCVGVSPSSISSLGGGKAGYLRTLSLARSRLVSYRARELSCVGRY
jgi:hypothetical protein